MRRTKNNSYNKKQKSQKDEIKKIAKKQDGAIQKSRRINVFHKSQREKYFLLSIYITYPHRQQRHTP